MVLVNDCHSDVSPVNNSDSDLLSSNEAGRGRGSLYAINRKIIRPLCHKQENIYASMP